MFKHSEDTRISLPIYLYISIYTSLNASQGMVSENGQPLFFSLTNAHTHTLSLCFSELTDRPLEGNEISSGDRPIDFRGKINIRRPWRWDFSTVGEQRDFANVRRQDSREPEYGWSCAKRWTRRSIAPVQTIASSIAIRSGGKVVSHRNRSLLVGHSRRPSPSRVLFSRDQSRTLPPPSSYIYNTQPPIHPPIAPRVTSNSLWVYFVALLRLSPFVYTVRTINDNNDKNAIGPI